jgi:Rrf2 family transcriptional regulator, iron-sulfur cluster assembly transcription factor
MSVLPRRARLAMAAVLEVALHARGAPLSAKALTERLGLPPRTLELIMQALVKAQFLKGTRGPRGGYELNKERRFITVADIVRASLEGVDEETGSISEQLASSALKSAEEACFAALSSLTLEDLCEQAKLTQSETSLDFTI